jgi:hypothetical protein
VHISWEALRTSYLLYKHMNEVLVDQKSYTGCRI